MWVYIMNTRLYRAYNSVILQKYMHGRKDIRVLLNAGVPIHVRSTKKLSVRKDALIAASKIAKKTK